MSLSGVIVLVTFKHVRESTYTFHKNITPDTTYTTTSCMYATHATRRAPVYSVSSVWYDHYVDTWDASVCKSRYSLFGSMLTETIHGGLSLLLLKSSLLCLLSPSSLLLVVVVSLECHPVRYDSVARCPDNSLNDVHDSSSGGRRLIRQ